MYHLGDELPPFGAGTSYPLYVGGTGGSRKTEVTKAEWRTSVEEREVLYLRLNKEMTASDLEQLQRAANQQGLTLTSTKETNYLFWVVALDEVTVLRVIGSDVKSQLPAIEALLAEAKIGFDSQKIADKRVSEGYDPHAGRDQYGMVGQSDDVKISRF